MKCCVISSIFVHAFVVAVVLFLVTGHVQVALLLLALLARTVEQIVLAQLLLPRVPAARQQTIVQIGNANLFTCYREC